MKPKYAKTKWGRIQFGYHEDTETSNSVNEGWVVDKVTAHLEC